MIYLVGTNHELQHFGKAKTVPQALVNKARVEFQRYLRTQIERLQPVLVAEEFIEEVLDLMATQSTVKAVAEECCVAHQFSDADAATRGRLGVPLGVENLPEEERRRYHNIRENYWYEQIAPFVGKPVLFVCGAEHVRSFRAVLNENNCEVKTLCEYWGKEVYGA